jgi:hypothetical protein
VGLFGWFSLIACQDPDPQIPNEPAREVASPLACIAVGIECDDRANLCCDGAMCLKGIGAHPVCALTCVRSEDCESGCCKLLDWRPTAVCVESSRCQPN